MERYLERIKKIVKVIGNNPYVEIVDFRINSPIKKKIFDQVEADFKITLDNKIKTFYSQLNGLYLHWRIKTSLSEDEVEKIRIEYDDYWIEFPEDTGNPFAKISILPLEETFFEKDWIKTCHWDTFEKESAVEFSDKIYSRNEFARNIKPFDLYSEYACMSYLVNGFENSTDIILLKGHYAEWDNTRVTDFETYLESIFRTFGIEEARDNLYSEYRGDKLPKVTMNSINWKEVEPRLFKYKVKGLRTRK